MKGTEILNLHPCPSCCEGVMLKQSPAFAQLRLLAAVRLAQPVQQTELAELTGGNTANHAPVTAWFLQVGQDVCSAGMVQSAGDSMKPSS